MAARAAAEQGRRAGRPKTPVLSRTLIFETALRLVDERGADSGGIRDIARELGVQPSALYNHVRGRDDIIDGIRDLVVERLEYRLFDTLPWDEALTRWADSYRIAFAAHPPTILLLATRPLAPDSKASLMYDAVTAGLVRAGWPVERVLSIVVAIEAFVLGAALDTAADADMLDPGPREDVPRFRTAFDARRDTGIDPAQAAYRVGRDALVDGLRLEFRRLQQEERVPPSA